MTVTRAATTTDTTLVSNIDQIRSSFYFLNSNFPKLAQSFETGSNSGGYNLASAGMRFSSAPSSSSDVVVTIREDDSGNPSDIVFATLVNPATFTGNAVNTFTAPANTVLAKDTTYFVHIERVGTSNASLRATSSDGESSAEAGWSMGNSGHFTDSTEAWTTGAASLHIQVTGSAAAEPTDPLIYTNYYAGAAFDVMIVFRKNHIHGSPVTGFDLDDITVTNGTARNLTDVYGPGVVWRVTVTPTNSTQRVTVDVAAGAATDAAGSPTEAGRTLTVLSYAAGPVVGLSIYEDTGVYRAQFVFRGTTDGLDCDTEVTVSGATPERIFEHIPSNCDMWLRPTDGQGDITITIAADAYEDGDSVTNVAFSYTITR